MHGQVVPQPSDPDGKSLAFGLDFGATTRAPPKDLRLQNKNLLCNFRVRSTNAVKIISEIFKVISKTVLGQNKNGSGIRCLCLSRTFLCLFVET